MSRILDTLYDLRLSQSIANDDIAEIKKQQDDANKHLKAIETRVNELPCAVQVYKISLLQKIVYGGIGLILVGFIVGLTDRSTYNKDAEAMTKTAQYVQPINQPQPKSITPPPPAITNKLSQPVKQTNCKVAVLNNNTK